MVETLNLQACPFCRVQRKRYESGVWLPVKAPCGDAGQFHHANCMAQAIMSLRSDLARVTEERDALRLELGLKLDGSRENDRDPLLVQVEINSKLVATCRRLRETLGDIARNAEFVAAHPPVQEHHAETLAQIARAALDGKGSK